MDNSFRVAPCSQVSMEIFDLNNQGLWLQMPPEFQKNKTICWGWWEDVRDLEQTLDSSCIFARATELWVRSLPHEEVEYNFKWKLRNIDSPGKNRGLLRKYDRKYKYSCELFAEQFQCLTIVSNYFYSDWQKFKKNLIRDEVYED